jgi:hypothetical protein
VPADYNGSAFDFVAMGRRLAEWEREAPSRFSKLHLQVEEWDRSERGRTKLLKFLDEVKIRGMEGLLTGYLSEGIRKDGSYIRQAVSRERRRRLELLSKAVSTVAKAAEALRQLAKLDEDRVHALISDTEKESCKSRINMRRGVADQLMVEAALLTQESKSVRRLLSTQRLGTSHHHWNVECLLRIRSWLAPRLKFTLTYKDMALLIDAAHTAWSGRGTAAVTTDPKSLKRAFKRFHERNPDIVTNLA